MKTLLLIGLFMVGCATASEKTALYCDDNWQGRYDSWQDCYDRQLSEHKSKIGALLKSAGSGLQNSRGVSCTTLGNQTNCR